MGEDYFGEQVAERYDASESDEFSPSEIEATVAFLADLVRDGSALELGIGTGRIALPCTPGESACTASTCRARWSPDFAPNRGRKRLA